MPSSPKLFHSRPLLSTLRPTDLIVFISVGTGLTGFLSGLSTILIPGLRLSGRTCLTNFPPKTVRVVWDVSGNSNGNGVSGGVKRHKVMGFFGIQTGFRSAGRRRALRNTWMPSDPEGLRRLEESTGLAIRFSNQQYLNILQSVEEMQRNIIEESNAGGVEAMSTD